MLLSLFFLAMLPACGRIGDRLPALGSEAQFRHTPPQTETSADLTLWWQAFADPRLVQLLQRTARANAEVRIAVQRLRQARQGVIAAEASLWPSLDLLASHTDARTSLPNFLKQGGMPDLQSKRLSLAAQWELDLFGGQQAARSAAEQEAAAAHYGIAGAQLLAISETARHYLHWHGLQERINLLQAVITNQEEERQRIRSQHREGWLAEPELARADAAYNETAALLPALRTQQSMSEHRIALLSGDDPSLPVPELQLAGVSPLQQIPVVNPGQPLELLQRRPDLLAAERQLAAASARWQEARSQHLPKIFLSALFGRQALLINHSLQPGTSPFANVAATFSLPLLHAGAIEANMAAHEAREQELWLEYEKKLHQAIEEVENLLLALHEEQQTASHHEASRQARWQASQRTTSLLRAGEIGLIPHLQAERAHLAALLKVNESQTQRALLTVQLFTALGGGWQTLPQPIPQPEQVSAP